MLFFGLSMAVFQAFKLYTNTHNLITGEEQRVQWSTEEEVAIGLQSRHQMVQLYGGLHPDESAREEIEDVGKRLINNSIIRNSRYPVQFYLLKDDRTVNGFALPGGQVFITAALFSKFENEDQLAEVLGHEIGHVIHRHVAERMASQVFIQGVIQSVMIGSGGNGSVAQIASVVGNYSSMSYGRDQELESDDFGVRLMVEAGYDAKKTDRYYGYS
ncbi:MAG: putative Zn-dependent protease [Saprospiraceae bacterium]|jgi:predicted Zn-dependent protease